MEQIALIVIKGVVYNCEGRVVKRNGLLDLIGGMWETLSYSGLRYSMRKRVEIRMLLGGV